MPATRPPVVRLQPIDDASLVDVVLAAAVADAPPEEVMPPVPGPPGWSEARRDAFRAHHLARLGGLDGPAAEQCWAVLADDQVAGVVRVQRHPDGRHEVGIWLTNGWRGRGVGRAAIGAVRVEAARLGVDELVAVTTADNAAALGALRPYATRTRRRADGTVHVHL